MIPETDVQLGAVAKSLADNVMPVVMASGDAMAIEQLQLCLATLGIVQQRLPDLHAALRCDLLDSLSLLKSVAAGDQADSDLIGAGEDMLAASRHSPQQVEQQVRAVKERIAGLLEAARGTPRQDEIAAAIMAAQPAMTERQRAWAIPMGFEPDPSQVPDLKELINKAGNI